MNPVPAPPPGRPSAVTEGDQDAESMTGAPVPPARLPTLGVYLAALLLSVAALVLTLRLWKADLHVPLRYSSDALLYQAMTKGLVEQGWYLHNPRLGAPGGLDLHDFPESDNLHFLLVGLLGLVVRDYVVAYNLYFLLTFPLTTLTSLYVFRRFRVSAGPALVASLLFAFLPYHLQRGVSHYFLTAYYLVPLMVGVLLDVALGRLPFFHEAATTRRPRFTLRGRRSWAAVAVCLLTAVAGVYYAAFACGLLLVAGLIDAFRRGRPHALAASALLIATVVLFALANGAPTLLYRWQNGANPSAVIRRPSESEIYGLKITALVLPRSNHRLPALNDLGDRYRALTVPAMNESDSASLGAVGAVGFLLLLGRLLFVRRGGAAPGPPDALAVLCAAAVLVGTVSGFGAVFNYLLFDWVRAYNRVSVYIGFFSFFAASLLLDGLLRRCVHSAPARVLYHGLLGAVLVLGLLDCTSRADVPPYTAQKRAYTADREYVRMIEARVPPASMIFQLPYRPFPEGGPAHEMPEYDQLRPYLHSRTLRWSFAAMKGREGDLWQEDLAARPPEDLLERLSFAGFGGIYVNRTGYADGGRALEGRLADLLGAAPLVSADGSRAFFDLGPYNGRKRAGCPGAEWGEKQDRALYPILLRYADGFSDRWSRWCAAKGQAVLFNHGRQARRVVLEMTFRTADGRATHLRVAGPLFRDDVPITDGGGSLVRTLTVPPGDHRITFECDGPEAIVLESPRPAAFRVESVKITELDPGAAPGVTPP